MSFQVQHQHQVQLLDLVHQQPEQRARHYHLELSQLQRQPHYLVPQVH